MGKKGRNILLVVVVQTSKDGNKASKWRRWAICRLEGFAVGVLYGNPGTLVSIRYCGVGGGDDGAKGLPIDSGVHGEHRVGVLDLDLFTLLGEKLNRLRFCFECLVEVGFFCVMRVLSVVVILRANL